MADLKDWPRAQYRKGGADAFLAYVVFGKLDHLDVSRSRYRTNGLPAGVSARTGVRCDDLRSGLFGSMLAKHEPPLATSVASAPNCVVVMGSVPDPKDLNYLRDTVGVVTAMWDVGAVAVLDMQSFRWYSKAEWHTEIFDPDGAVPRHHVSILWSEEDGRLWFHTRGMRKFGRPDISVTRVPSDPATPSLTSAIDSSR